MTRVIAIRKINASVDTVFKAISDIENLPNAIPYTKKIEFLSDIKTGVGTRFRETRLMDGKESLTELEITEYLENEYVRMVADSHGTIWDSLFAVKSIGEQTELKLTMDAKGSKFLQRFMNLLFKSLYKKGLEKHMDEVKKFCEKQ